MDGYLEDHPTDPKWLVGTWVSPRFAGYSLKIIVSWIGLLCKAPLPANISYNNTTGWCDMVRPWRSHVPGIPQIAAMETICCQWTCAGCHLVNSESFATLRSLCWPPKVKLWSAKVWLFLLSRSRRSRDALGASTQKTRIMGWREGWVIESKSWKGCLRIIRMIVSLHFTKLHPSQYKPSNYW
jgi:hypothetical protein